MNFVFCTGMADPFPEAAKERRFAVVKAALDSEFRLARLLGWTNIFIVGESLIGTPPSGAPQCRGQAAVPRWSRDWNACGPLMIEHRLIWHVEDDAVYAGRPSGQVLAGIYLEDLDLEFAVMSVLVRATITIETQNDARGSRGSDAQACPVAPVDCHTVVDLRYGSVKCGGLIHGKVIRCRKCEATSILADVCTKAGDIE